MKSSYTLTPVLTSNLNQIKQLRSEILLTTIKKDIEIELKYNFMISRIYWSLNFVEPSITKSEVANIINQHFGLFDSSSNKKYKKPNEKLVLGYKRASDYIDNTWYAEDQRPIQTEDIQKILKLLGLNSNPKNKEELEKTINYLNDSSSEPILKAGIAQITLIMSNFFEDGNGRLARLMSYLILNKYGLDFRGQLNIDAYFRKDISILEVIIRSIHENKSLNIWLEHYTTGMVIQLERALREMKDFSISSNSKLITKLNERQKKIIDVSSFPHASITNKKVQKIFGVSQITSSRDLAKLAAIGLLVPHGKGRSVYYTRS